MNRMNRTPRTAPASPASPASPSGGLVEALLREWHDNARRWEPVREWAETEGFACFNPGLYGLPTYDRFLRAFRPRKGAILALGLNPGPAGMAQTGIPFTDCRTADAKLGLGLTMPGHAPAALAELLRKENGKFRLTYERSSLVVYRFLEETWGSLAHAYENWYVGNPCPLLFLEKDGANVTPAHPKLRRDSRMADLRCEAVRRFAAVLEPRAIVAMGNDVAQAVEGVAVKLVGESRFIRYPHPARAAPATWGKGLAAELQRCGSLEPGARGS
ncbi:MAG: uracil-DNA glycosylase family protein [Thermoplasmatota archaeon]